MDSPEEQIANLESENAALRIELGKLKEASERGKQLRARILRFTGIHAVRLILGLNLSTALKLWLGRLVADKEIPIDDTAHLASAILGRIVRVGAVGLLVSVVPIVLLASQTFLLSE
ncbi:MAG: hypothetical protein GY847_40540 [Proteobacteria bacterium]|nr:hypothetical protein [Pseudomonadota bacterium]